MTLLFRIKGKIDPGSILTRSLLADSETASPVTSWPIAVHLCYVVRRFRARHRGTGLSRLAGGPFTLSDITLTHTPHLPVITMSADSPAETTEILTPWRPDHTGHQELRADSICGRRLVVLNLGRCGDGYDKPTGAGLTRLIK